MKDTPVSAAARRCVIYARVSSKEQEREGFSIPAQLKLLREYAAESSFDVLHEYIDVETAKQAGRSEFGEMIVYLEAHPDCHVVLVEKTDRLYRNLRDWVTLDDLDLELHFVKEGVVFSSDSRSSEKFVHGIKVLMAKNYVDNLSEETRKGMLEKAEQGIWPSRAPLGYRNVDTAEGKKVIEPDPELGPFIARLFEWYGTGQHSLADVTEKARSEGFSYRKSGDPVPRSTVHKILRNRIYMGDFKWDGELYVGTHEAIVSRDLWERAQELLDGRSSGRTCGKRSFAFSGLVTCGHCGRSLVGEIKKGKYVYYHCAGPNRTCPEPYVREEKLSEHFARALGRLEFDEQVAEWIVQALRESHSDEKRVHNEAIARLQGEHTKLQNRLEAMYEDKLDGKVTEDFFERKQAEWRDEQDRVHRLIADHQSANRTYIDEGIELLALARRARELFERQEPKEQRRLLRFVLSNSVWKDGELAVTYRQPFDMLAVAAVAAGVSEAGEASDSARTEKWLPGPYGLANSLSVRGGWGSGTKGSLRTGLSVRETVRIGGETDSNSSPAR